MQLLHSGNHVRSDEKEFYLATRKRAPEAATRPGHIMYNVECNPSPSTCTSSLLSLFNHHRHPHIMVKAWRQWHGHRHRQQPLLEVQQAWEDCHQPEDIKCYFKFSQDDEAK